MSPACVQSSRSSERKSNTWLPAYVQSMIDGEYLARPGEEPPCRLDGPHTWPQAGPSLPILVEAGSAATRTLPPPA